MSSLFVAEKKLYGEIMSCDTYIKITSTDNTKEKLGTSIESCIDTMKKFEQNYSRFIENNELTNFNKSQGTIEVSNELLQMVAVSQKLYEQTDHIFDIGILPALIDEGYVRNKKLGFIDN
jgi:thiamine biosynthesis lipoprotein ApbE